MKTDRDCPSTLASRALLAAASLAAVLCACGGCRAPHESRGRGEESAIFSPSDPGIRYVGRFDRSDPAVARFAWPATAFELRFRGTSLALELEDTALPDGTEENDWLAISIDGGVAAPLELSQGRRVYEIARGLAKGNHTARISKRTEAEVGAVGLWGIRLEPGASLGQRPEAPRRILEMVGDSISTGFGIEGKDASCPFTAATEDATRTYGALAARAFGADVWITAWKGKGVLRNDDPTDRDTLPALFDRILPARAAPRWSYTAHPDVVVLNLGTNDFARSAPEGDDFRAAYAAFVDRLRALHPRALLVLAVGPMLFDEGAIDFRTRAREAITAVADERRRTGDAAVEMLELWADPADGVGCQYHPNLATHEKMAGALARLLEARLGWTPAR